MLQFIKVTGHSLSPGFKEGDFVLVLKIPFLLHKISIGDVVVFKHPRHGLMIKKVDAVSENGEELFVIGEHPDSTDSREFGPIHRDALVGKVLWHINQSNT